jgi:hypothetical protein
MKQGGGKSKGSTFERKLCTILSNWVSGGKDADLFWRSAISGGRATVAQRKGRNIKATGDICAVSPKGHELTDHFFIECKHYKSLQVDRFIIGTGRLAQFWTHAGEQAKSHNLEPMLIARQNMFPILLIVPHGALPAPEPIAVIRGADVFLFDDAMKAPWRQRRVRTDSWKRTRDLCS